MEVVLIVAVAKYNNGIGKDNKLLWHLPADMKFFRTTTTGYPVITGRKNYESIPEKFRPLPKRENIIITRQDIKYPNAQVCNSIEKALELAKNHKKEKVFIIGGGQIYQQFLDKDLIDKVIITWVDSPIDADVFFPELNSNWKVIKEEPHAPDEKNKYAYTFTEYSKKNNFE